MDGHENDAASWTEETTATKRHRLTTTSTRTLTSPLPSLSSSSDNSLAPLPLPTLPFELVVEILCRLPVKFLLQLQCICKSWKSLISDTKFSKKHLLVSTELHYLILTFTNPSREFTLMAYPLPSVFTATSAAVSDAMQLQYPMNNHSRFDFLVGSCDGILCFAINQNCAFLWNPSIRKFNKLPNLENPRLDGSYTIYGFGYDNYTDEYKVVAVFCHECDSDGKVVYKNQVKVYTFGAGCWRRIQEFPYGVPFDESGKFVSGTINWLASKDLSSSWIIVSLDLGKESYQEVLQPDYGGMGLVTLTLGVLRDCLCIVSHSDTFSEIWVMKEYGNKESWTKLFHVPYMGDLANFTYTKVLHVYEDDQVLLELQSGLVVYNSRDGTFKTPQIQNTNGWMVPEVYVESLISPCS